MPTIRSGLRCRVPSSPPRGETSLPELFERARAQLDRGDAVAAAREFDRIVELEPKGDLAPESLHLGALAHERAGDREAALARFERLARQFPHHALGRDALTRVIRLLAFLERWQRAGEASDLFLKRFPDPRPIEGVVALSGRALGYLSRGDLDRASFSIEKGRNLIEAHRLDRAGAVPRDIAQLYYALGEVRRRRAERIVFNPMPANFAAVLERRCQLLLDAQSAYSDTMRAYDAHWSAMAGYRVGELYQRLHQDLMEVPLPKTADSERRKQLFEGAVRLRYSVLLEKALTMMKHTRDMARRTGERSQWVTKAEQGIAQLQKARAAENAAIDRLPYTRAQLKAALDELGKKAQAKNDWTRPGCVRAAPPEGALALERRCAKRLA